MFLGAVSVYVYGVPKGMDKIETGDRWGDLQQTFLYEHLSDSLLFLSYS